MPEHDAAPNGRGEQSPRQALGDVALPFVSSYREPWS